MEEPKLEYRERVGRFGEVVSEPTPESDHIWTKYLRQQTLAKIALRRLLKENED